MLLSIILNQDRQKVLIFGFNQQRIMLGKFGAPLDDLTIDDFCNQDMVYQIGIEPNRIDILMGVEGLNFSEAWENRVTGTYAGEKIYYLSRTDLIRSKEISARPQDLADVEKLKIGRESG